MTEADWYRRRRYLHFDRPVGFSKAARIVMSTASVSQHSFLPFISYKVKSKKVSSNERGEIIAKVKERPIAFASHVDSHIYAYYCELLSGPYESRLQASPAKEAVLAFRKLGKSNIDFALDAFNRIKKHGSCTAIAYDISGFFDNIDHDFLKKAWAEVLGATSIPRDHYAVYKAITRYSEVEKVALYKALGLSLNNPPKGIDRICEPAEFRALRNGSRLIRKNTSGKGIPQGSPISALLSNIYMYEFDQLMVELVAQWGGTYYRYCDDMLFIVPTEQRNKLSDSVVPEIKKLKLKINPLKTAIVDFSIEDGVLEADKSLQYLGFVFDGQRILLRSSSLARYSERMKRGVKLAKKTRAKYNRIEERKGLAKSPLFKKKLYGRYSHLGRRNFVVYALRASKKMESPEIRRQLKPLWGRLKAQIDKPL